MSGADRLRCRHVMWEETPAMRGETIPLELGESTHPFLLDMCLY